MKKITSFFDDLLKIFAVSSLLLIIIGFVDLKLYYSNFGININDYTNTSEILLSSIDKLAYVLFIMLVQISIWLYFFDYLFAYDFEESIKDGEPKPQYKHDETLYRFIKNKFFLTFILILSIGIIIVAVLHILFPNIKFIKLIGDFIFLNLWIALCMYMFLLQATRKLWEILKKNKEHNVKVIITLIIFILVSLTSLWLTNNTQYNRVRKFGNEESLEILLNENSTIKPTDTIRYVGRTENYVFYWNKITHQTDIYPKGEIKKITIKE